MFGLYLEKNYPLMIKRLLIVNLCAFLFSLTASAQKDVSKRFTRLSGELGAGVPILFGSIPNNVTAFGTAAIRYSLSKEISLGFMFDAGTFSGSQTPPGPYKNPSRLASNFYSFQNNFYLYGGFLQFNLVPLFNLRNYMPRLNPYIIGGMGRLYGSIQTERLLPDNSRTKLDVPGRDYYTYFAGMSFKYYLSPQLDFVFTAIYHGTETTVIDGIPGYPDGTLLKQADPKYFDSYIMPFIGINYKFLAGANVEHVDWYNVIFKRKKKVVDPDYPEEMPITMEGAEISEDSIKTIIAENNRLKEEKNKLTLEIDSLKKQVVILQDSLRIVANPNSNNISTGGNADSSAAQGGGQLAQNQQAGKTATGQQAGQQGAKQGVKQIAQPGVVGGVNVNAIQPQNDGITTPPEKYNVVVGCYSSRRYAFIFRDRMRSLGYNANIYRSSDDSRMLRVTILSTADYQDALQVMRMARQKIDPASWIHIYNKPQ